MFKALFFAIVQAATEFLPVSSSGHLALLSRFFTEPPDIFFFTALHLASLAAVLIFTRKEIVDLVLFKRKHRKLWIYLSVATLPAALFGLFFKDRIESAFSSLLFLGIAFIFTGVVLLLTRLSKIESKLNSRNSFFIGLFQALALFPGISRSGMTISSALMLGIDREKAAKFSFLLYIPITAGAFLLEAREKFYFNPALLAAFLVCLVASLFFLNILLRVIKGGKFFLFSLYCFAVGAVTLLLYFK